MFSGRICKVEVLSKQQVKSRIRCCLGGPDLMLLIIPYILFILYGSSG